MTGDERDYADNPSTPGDEPAHHAGTSATEEDVSGADAVVDWAIRHPGSLLAGIGAVIAVVVLLAVLLSGGDSEDPVAAEPTGTTSSTSDPADGTTDTTAPTGDAASDGPQVPPVSSCGLVTGDEFDVALGLEELPFSDRSFLQGSFGEGCTWQNLRDGEIVEGLSLYVGPGTPDDFADGATVDGSTGTAVDGVGDLAVWFGGPDAGTLSVVGTSSYGYVFLRVTLERSGADDAERRRAATVVAASVLPRLPGVDVPAPELDVIELVAPEAPPTGLVGNLLAREEAGDWTRGEGLLATLQLITGDTDPASVLANPDEESEVLEATGITQMAEEFGRTDPDDAMNGDIAELVGRLVFSNEQLETMAGIGAASAEDASAGSGYPGDVQAVRASAQRTQAPAEGFVDCEAFFYYFEITPGVGDCVEWEPVNIGPGVEDRYRIFHPAPHMPQGGWSAADFGNARAAIEHAAPIYEGLGLMPSVNVVFTAVPGGSTYMSATNQTGGKPCGVFIYQFSQSLTVPQFQQVLAHELAHCFTAANLTPQSRIAYPVKKWWEEGVADYLSNVAYPTVNFEHKAAAWLARIELPDSVVERDYENFALFQHVANGASTEFVLTMLATMPGCGTASTELAAGEWATCLSRGIGEQAEVLANFPEMRETYHEFVERLGDASIPDAGGGTIPYKPPSETVSDVGEYTYSLDRMEVMRIHLEVPDGQTACLSHDLAGGVVTSWREGAPDGDGIERRWDRTLPLTLERNASFVSSSIVDGATVTLVVEDFVDSPEDCPDDDQEGEADADACLIDICGSSEFYEDPNALENWIAAMLPPLSTP